MAEHRPEDLAMMYDCSIVLYKDNPVLVTEVHGTKFRYWCPVNGDKVCLFNPEDWKSPTRRIGMVNIGGTVAYVSRRPVRKYSVGFNSNNLSIVKLEGASSTIVFRTIHSLIMGLRVPGLYDSINNVYPSFPEAFKQAVELKGCVAFDKQFAVDSKFQIFYKDKHVGFIPKDAKNIEDIDFMSGYSYLNLLLQDGYKNLGSIS